MASKKPASNTPTPPPKKVRNTDVEKDLPVPTTKINCQYPSGFITHCMGSVYVWFKRKTCFHLVANFEISGKYYFEIHDLVIMY